MDENKFNIKRVYDTIIMEKDGKRIGISQANDNDIWFEASESDVTIELKTSFRDYKEYEVHNLFETLMKSIMGRYILSGDYKRDFSMLPDDFIDLETNTIKWHCDGGLRSTLMLQYKDLEIKVTVSKDNDAKEHDKNAVRIRTSGSSYMWYYHEFLKFFRELCILENTLNENEKKVTQSKPSKPKSKILSLFNNKNK